MHSSYRSLGIAAAGLFLSCASSISIAADQPVFGPGTYNVSTFDGSQVRFVPGPGNEDGLDPGGPGGGRASIRITSGSSGMSGFVGIDVYNGTTLADVIQMHNIAHVEPNVERFPAYSSATEMRDVGDMLSVLRASLPSRFRGNRLCVVSPFTPDENSASAISLATGSNLSEDSIVGLLPNWNGTYSSAHVVSGITSCLVENRFAAIVVGFVGLEPSLMEQQAIELATSKGVAVFTPVMSGEYSGRDEPGYPAGYSSSIAIGTVERNGDLAWWSPESREVDFVAPAQLPVDKQGTALSPGRTQLAQVLLYGLGYMRMIDGYQSASLGTVNGASPLPVQTIRTAMEDTARSLPSPFDRRYSGSGAADFDAAKAGLARAEQRVRPIIGVGSKPERRGNDITIKVNWDGGDNVVEIFQLDSQRVSVQRNRGEANFVIRNASEHGTRSLRICNLNKPSQCGYAQVYW